MREATNCSPAVSDSRSFTMLYRLPAPAETPLYKLLESLYKLEHLAGRAAHNRAPPAAAGAVPVIP